MHTKLAPSDRSAKKNTCFECACALQYMCSLEFDKSRYMVSILYKINDMDNLFQVHPTILFCPYTNILYTSNFLPRTILHIGSFSCSCLDIYQSFSDKLCLHNYFVQGLSATRSTKHSHWRDPMEIKA